MGDSRIKCLDKIINTWKMGTILTDWTIATIMPIFKKGDNKNTALSIVSADELRKIIEKMKTKWDLESTEERRTIFLAYGK
jgi:hypothetical protein